MIVSAPFPGTAVICYWPDPLLSDTEQITDNVDLKRSMNGETYTYVKKTDGRSVFNWSFLVTRQKGLEIIEFHRFYAKDKWHIVDHLDQVIIGYCKTNPLVYVSSRRGEYCPDETYGSEETGTIDLEFEGHIQ